MINIETTFPPLGFAEPPEGVTKTNFVGDAKREADTDMIIQFTLLLGSIPASVISMWIYDKIKSKKDYPKFKLKINKRELTDLSESGIRKVIEEEIEIEIK
ncbi:hypothetical protein P4C99_21610 [Pontiellaceae bacterium B1224]|nr:hypothetical protein [Pontiellaceae bacterium B1224]